MDSSRTSSSSPAASNLRVVPIAAEDFRCEFGGEGEVIDSKEFEGGVVDVDEKRLNELGYTQEYDRVITPFQQFAYTFTYTAPLGFVTGYYGFMYCYGGPVVIFWGMLITALSTLSMVLAIAEVYSVFPALGSVYYWVAKLQPQKKLQWLSWSVGWVYTVGAVCGAALNEYLLAKYVQTIILLSTGGAQGGGFNLRNLNQVAMVTAGFFVLHLGISVVSSKWLGYLSCGGAWFQMASTLGVTLTLVSVAPKFQSFEFVFTNFVKAPGQGIHSSSMVVALGLPYLQAILTGFDVGSHIVEEVKTAATAGPRAMVRSVYAAAGVDLLLLVVMTFCIQNPENLLAVDTATGGGNESAGVQLFFDCFHARFKHGATGAVIFTGLAAISLFLANIINITLTARCVYAMARDMALPFHGFLTKLSAGNKIPSIGSSVAFTAIAAMSTVTAFIPYIVVLVCKHLGAWGAIWGLIITILFCLPLTFPIHLQTFNYTAASLAGTALAGGIYWIAYGKRTYSGPRQTI